MRASITITASALALAVTSVASGALAQTFGSKGDAVFSAERLFGFQATHVFEERDGPPDDYEADWTYFGIGWRGPFAGDLSPYDTPRLAFDYLIIDSLSIGGSLGFASIEGDDDADFIGADTDASVFLLSPRVGYIYMFNEVIGIWPRGGFTYHSLNADDALDENGLGLNLEVMFPITPIEHFGFVVGPTFDIDFTGGREYETGEENDRRYRSFGLQAGLFGWI